MAKYRPPKLVKKAKLRKILKGHGCTMHTGRGKGSHWCATRVLANGKTGFYTFPDHRDFGRDYISRARIALELTKADGVSDREFFEV